MQNKNFQKNKPSKREVEVDWESIFLCHFGCFSPLNRSFEMPRIRRKVEELVCHNFETSRQK